MMRQDEDRRVIGRLIAPPAFPAMVRPGAADGAEHVSAQNPGAEVLEALLGDLIVGSGFSTGLAVHGAKRSRGEEPIHQLGPSDAEGIVLILIWAGAKAVDGDRETLDANFGGHLPRQFTGTGGDGKVRERLP